ncbi:MAG: hypothetical protein NT140_08990 [Deltaproteobacteria bacterium]|nr:hypothetical protein [Deltaproteobacteria bacterium]
MDRQDADPDDDQIEDDTDGVISRFAAAFPEQDKALREDLARREALDNPPPRQKPTREDTKRQLMERLEIDANKEKMVYDQLKEVYETAIEGAGNEKDVKKIKKAFHQFAADHPNKSKPYWTTLTPAWKERYDIVTRHLKRYPRQWDFLNAIKNYDQISQSDLKDIVKTGDKSYLAFVADAKFYSEMSAKMKLSESGIRKYLAGSRKLGALRKIGATGMYHNQPVYAFGYYTGAVIDNHLMFAWFLTEESIKKLTR